MGTKNRSILVLVLIIGPLFSMAQKSTGYQKTDSLTYAYYVNGQWDKLIWMGNEALKSNIDFKYLRQRLAYAYFLKGNYADSKVQFEKALKFDSYDPFTLEYLYYDYLYTGKEEYAGNVTEQLSPELKKKLAVSSFKPAESVDFEYNFKYSTVLSRSNPNYVRFGLSSKLSNKLTLYQSVSYYTQNITLQQVTSSYNQPEYFAMLKWNPVRGWLVKPAYHYFRTSSSGVAMQGNLVSLSVAPDLDRWTMEASGSFLRYYGNKVLQAGLQVGYTFPGKSAVYLTGALTEVSQSSVNSLLYTQKVGLKLTKKIWAEGSMTAGRMENYNDYNGLYVYNSYDPMLFRGGATLFFPLTGKISLWTNFSMEQKELLENSTTHYNQFSFLGGIKCKL